VQYNDETSRPNDQRYNMLLGFETCRFLIKHLTTNANVYLLMIIVIYYSINILVIKSVMIACYNGILFFMEAGQSHTGPLQSVNSLQHAY